MILTGDARTHLRALPEASIDLSFWSPPYYVGKSYEAMGLSEMHLRLYGKVDVKKAIYVFAPDAEPVALMLDAKAEKSASVARLQMSQTSMTVHQRRGDESVTVGIGHRRRRTRPVHRP